ncbi:aminoglycoside 6-adenylyltransferase [Candidatus Pacearchaeota archaeon]|nr:aminoglycoside 6-adenylyltransferase [Candidatus Pacearchaeota archaeon]
MVKCSTCSKELIDKKGSKKFCAQIGNPELAIVETENPKFCDCCNEYYLDTPSIAKAVFQIKLAKEQNSTSISKGIYC